MKTQINPARVRFAPSPTGRIHIGNARTALYDYLLAQQTGGQFILRIEDTDQNRFDPHAELELIESLKWLGLHWDEGPDVGGPHAPYRQSARKEIYQQYAEQLIAARQAYYCFCTPQRLSELRQSQIKSKEQPRYDGLCRSIDPGEAAQRAKDSEPHVIRFRMPREGSIRVVDHIRGEIVYENRSLDDTILVKTSGLPVYHLAAMVDDHLMQITHVFRGAEWLPTFPLHVHIYNAFGWEQPTWIHLSLFLKPSGKGKMSKRESQDMQKGGRSIFLKELEALGYLPEAVNNWLALMGWSYDDHTEFFGLRDLVEKFDIDRLNAAAAAINFSKFDHFNGLHIRNLAKKDLATRLRPFFQRAGYDVKAEELEPIMPLIQERIVTLDEAPRLAGFFFEANIVPTAESLIGKKMSVEQSLRALQASWKELAALENFTTEDMEPILRQLADQLGLKPGQLFGILRVAVTGQTVSPPLFESMEIIGRERVIERLEQAARLLETVRPSGLA